jgi:hypothetical protein
MTTSRERALTLAPDIVKKQAGRAVYAGQISILMQGRNAKTTAVRNPAQVRARRAARGFGTFVAACASCPRKQQSYRRKTKTQLFQRRRSPPSF